MCDWRSKIGPQRHTCSMPPIDGSSLCIFHAPEPKNRDIFLRRFDEQISREGPEDEMNPQFDFTGYVFPPGLLLTTCGSDVMEFPKEAETRRFARNPLMTRSKTPQLILPGYAENEISFAESRIGNTVDLLGFESTSSISFESAEIFGSVHLQFAKMSTLDMREIVVWGDMKCTELQAKWLLARGSVVFGALELVGASFSGGVNLSQAIISEPYLKGCVSQSLLLNVIGDESTATIQRPSYACFQKARCGIELCGTHEAATTFWEFARQTYEKMPEADKADAAHYHKRISAISPLRFVDPNPHLRMGRLVSERRTQRWEQIQLERDPTIPKMKELAEFARKVKKEGRQARRSVVVLKRIASFVFQWVPDSLLLRWPTAYGASLGRLLMTWVLMIGGLGLLYYALHHMGVTLLHFDIKSPFTLGRAIYFSMVTFTTLGYGDIVPLPGLGSVLTSMEAVIGGIVMALTVVVIGRKFMR